MSKILLEDRRSQLLSRSKSGDNYVPWNQFKGKNRHQRRLHSRLASSVKHFNSINMNKFFKDDILDVNIDVKGETNIYVVRMSFVGTLDALHNFLKTSNSDLVDRKLITKALLRAFNNDDVYINCQCPDFRYRHKYWATRNNILIGTAENRPSNITNPNDTKGPGCKHIALALSDSSWLIKVGSVIFNYINYMQENDPRLYEKYIYPAIYQKPYEEEHEKQLSIFDDEDELMDTDTDTIDTANKTARERGRFKPGNEYRYRKNPDNSDDNQVSFNELENEEEEI